MMLETAVRRAGDDCATQVLADLSGLAERDHELRAALFAIEVTAAGLCRDRDRMCSRDVDALLDAVVVEIGRVRILLDGHRSSSTSFDLSEAIAAVVACARASGLVVNSSIPPGVQVQGRADSIAQVVVALVDNVRRHAGGSPVELGVAGHDDTVVLTVADRGPGLDAAVRRRLFERGARRATSDGSGLGLYLARRLLTDEGGEITVEARPGGGTTFLVQLQAGWPR